MQGDSGGGRTSPGTQAHGHGPRCRGCGKERATQNPARPAPTARDSWRVVAGAAHGPAMVGVGNTGALPPRPQCQNAPQTPGPGPQEPHAPSPHTVPRAAELTRGPVPWHFPDRRKMPKEASRVERLLRKRVPSGGTVPAVRVRKRLPTGRRDSRRRPCGLACLSPWHHVPGGQGLLLLEHCRADSPTGKCVRRPWGVRPSRAGPGGGAGLGWLRGSNSAQPQGKGGLGP